MSAVLTVLRMPLAPRTRREAAYLLVTLLPAVPPFAVAVVGIAATALSAVGIGLPVLAGVLALARLNIAYFRPPARAVLGWDWPSPAPLDRGGPVRRAVAVVRDGAAWRAMVYGLAKLPLTAIAVYGTVFAVVAGTAAVTYPLWWFLSPTVRGIVDDRPWPQTWLLAVQGALVLLALPWFLRLLVAVDHTLVQRLLAPDVTRERVATLEASRDALAADATATLRRIERDLHDGTQARLVTLGLTLSRLESKGSDAQVREIARAARQQVVDALAELRDIIRGMHPPALDDGLPTALSTLAARSVVPVEFRHSLRARPTDAQAATLYFSAAELLANVARHAKASQVDVRLVDRDDGIVLTVRDDGRGGAALGTDGTGLAGLDRRARVLDGTLTIDSPPGGPTTATVTLPKDPSCE